MPLWIHRASIFSSLLVFMVTLLQNISLHTEPKRFGSLKFAMSKENRLNEARELLRQLKLRDDIVPQPFVYNPVLDGFCKAGNLNQANIIAAEMESKGCCHDKITFTILILGHCMKGRMLEAMAIFSKMLSLGCVPDDITVSCLTSCLLKAGMTKEAYKVRLTSSKDLNPDFLVFLG